MKVLEDFGDSPLPWGGPIVSLRGMKQILLILAVVALVGCGKKEQATTEGPTPNTNTNKVDGTTEKSVKKLTVKEAGEVMAWEIGTWEVKGRGMPPGGEPHAIEMTKEVRWKEAGKSVEYKFTMEESGETVSYSGHQKYDADRGIFIYRSKWGENPETTSHVRYNPNTRTSYSESIPATPPTGIKSTAITKLIGNDKTEQKLEVRDGDRLVYSHEIVSVRIGNQD